MIHWGKITNINIAAMAELQIYNTAKNLFQRDELYFFIVLIVTTVSFQKELEEIINIARQAVISADMLPSVRCRLVQLIELSASGWEMSDELKLFYEDLQQDLMADGK